MYRADGTPVYVLFFIPRVETRGYKMYRASGSMREDKNNFAGKQVV